MELSGELQASATLSLAPIEWGAWWSPELDWMLWRGEKSCLYWELNPGSPTHGPLLYQLSYPNINNLIFITSTFTEACRSTQ
jgi:hypothetical protein